MSSLTPVGTSATVIRAGRSFLVVVQRGEQEMLAREFHEDAHRYQNGECIVWAAGHVLVGASRGSRPGVTVGDTKANDVPGIIVKLSGISQVLSLQVRDGRIYRLFGQCNPDRSETLAAPAKPAALES
ncbi:hypothetical protein JSO19_07190 [Leucobacter sp. UCMA 4100]|uniref:hypothetical protein n=1 Tax=Leucobacter sp. UCMA 4100 TaxID=2810534 RepID=UPI0022EB0E2A|nr:hypothetical protein [Leucobacter sp. UCMA 4100]MDA3147161.1 hypothetical protein [Leucobacter sp. UCMA 4100]